MQVQETNVCMHEQYEAEVGIPQRQMNRNSELATSSELDLAKLAGFGMSDAKRLRELKLFLTSHQQNIMSSFHERVLSFPFFVDMLETSCGRDKISVTQLIDHISTTQFQHWEKFFGGIADKAFEESARKIGVAHARCALTSDLHVASSAVLLENFIELILEYHLDDDARLESIKSSASAMIRLFFLDLSYAISAYDTAAAGDIFRQLSERLLNTFEQEVASDLQAMSTAAEELDATIKKNVELNKDNTLRCHDTVSNIEDLAKALADLSSITRHVENFVRVIREVSHKTKLLALNAAIEAARSGEYGRGFNVVASEVKLLANEAEDATREITRQANDIQAAISKAVKQVNDSQKLVQAIDNGVATENEAIRHQSVAVGEISTNLTAVAEKARGLRGRLERLEVA